MARVISGKALLEIIKEGKVIKSGSVNNCDAIKYDFVLDSKFLKAQYGGPVDYSNLKPIEQKEATIESGEVVFVLTKEDINLPENMFLQLSPKRGMTEFGILTLGGFAVDPGYSGKLMFGLYNFSSRPFRLLPGKKLVGAVFYQLDDDETADIDNLIPPKAINDFPPRLVDMIRECAPIGLKSLEDSVYAIKRQIEAIEKGVSDNKVSIEDLNKTIRKTIDNIDENNKQIERVGRMVDDLVTGLNQEVNLRKGLEKTLNEKVDKAVNRVDDKIKFLKGALWMATALGGIFVTLLITWLCGWLKF